MSAPDPEGMSLLGKIVAAATAVVVPVWGARTWLDSRFAEKADRKAVKEAFEKIEDELSVQRGNQGKIFDQMRDSEKANEARHRELMMHMLEKK